jgi:hypothetical protein
LINSCFYYFYLFQVIVLLRQKTAFAEFAKNTDVKKCLYFPEIGIKCPYEKENRYIFVAFSYGYFDFCG